MVSVTPRSAVRATSGASTKWRTAPGLEHDAVHDLLAVVIEHLDHRAHRLLVGAVNRRPALDRQVVDGVSVVDRRHRVQTLQTSACSVSPPSSDSSSSVAEV